MLGSERPLLGSGTGTGTFTFEREWAQHGYMNDRPTETVG
jgi:hypothetical protein